MHGRGQGLPVSRLPPVDALPSLLPPEPALPGRADRLLTLALCLLCPPLCSALQHKVPDKLTDPTSVTQIHAITKRIGMLVTGMAGEAGSSTSDAAAVDLVARLPVAKLRHRAAAAAAR